MQGAGEVRVENVRSLYPGKEMLCPTLCRTSYTSQLLCFMKLTYVSSPRSGRRCVASISLLQHAAKQMSC